MTAEKKKDTHIQIRLSTELADEWKKVTKRNAVNGSELLRRYIKEYVEQHKIEDSHA